MKAKLNVGSRRPLIATELASSKGGKEKLIGRGGELNASSVKDLFGQIGKMIETASTVGIETETQHEQRRRTAAVNREMVLAAFDNKEELAALGDLVADNLSVTGNREGLMRRLLNFKELTQGQKPEARMNMKNVEAAVATGPTLVRTSFVRDNLYYPPEFYITARPYIEQRDLDSSTDDLLEEKYSDALEATMVQEDRAWKMMADKLIGTANPHLNISGALTPQAFAELTDYVTRWGISAASALLASDLWKDIIANSAWHDIIDPVSQHELLLTGRLGTIHGMNLLTDAYRHDQHRVLNRGEIYVVGAPEQHGQYTDRGGITSQPIDGTQERVPGRGWFLSESMSMIIANSRSVARGTRK